MVFTAPDRWHYTVAMVIAELLIFISTGPVNSAILNVVEPDRRATAVALSILAIHALGDVPSPAVVGLVSEHSSLGRALLILPIAFGVSGLIWIWAAWRGERRSA
jgi:predicted MFS family arabinose efflux permease